MRIASLVASAAALVLALSVGAPPAAIAGSTSLSADLVDTLDTVDGGVYVVALREAPVATYAGGLAGYSATAPRPGERIDARSVAVQSYRALLLQRQHELLAGIGDPHLIYSYTTALNGFAARLTSAQVKALRSSPEVLAVQADTRVHADNLDNQAPVTLSSDAEAGTFPAAAQRGQGVVIGVVDSGIWPENPSFAEVPLTRGEVRRNYPGFSGTCPPADRWRSDSCNAKIVSARYFVKGFGSQHIASGEYLSVRDASGHGSSVASIAAGNDGVVATIDEQHFGRISGTAPSAALAVYKACWTAPEPSDDGCSIVDTVKAVDQAVSDGVDVLNYSLSAASTSPSDVVELAFLHAAAAGVFVVTSAGDDGPTPDRVAHGSPWVTTVAASTSSPYQGRVRLGNGHALDGSMVSNQAVGPAPLRYAGDAAAPGAEPARAALCSPGTLDAAQVRGSVVLCDRGVIARVTKSAAVAQAGGVAMILANRTADDEPVDVHVIPTVHLSLRAGNAVRRYLQNVADPTVRLAPSVGASSPVRPARFTSRGPSAGDADLLKPDLSAPGVGVMGATAPPADLDRLWDLSTGTSSSAPQVAGQGADLMAAHPDWSPAAVKSALMTTSSLLRGRAAVLAGGSGEVDPQAASNPGLVYDADYSDWMRYLAGSGVTYGDVIPVNAHPLQARDVNVASISIGSLVADQQVVRTVTNVSDRTETYVAQAEGLHGVDIAVTPPTMTLEPGQSRRFTVGLSLRRTAHYDAVTSGSLTWVGSSEHRVTSPIIIRPEYVQAPEGVLGSGSAGDLRLRAEAGVTGTITATMLGPVAARPVDLLLQPGRFSSTAPRRSASTFRRGYQVPPNTTALRYDVAAPNSSCDFDLYVYRGSELVAAETATSADEQVTLTHPDAGWYDVYVTAAPATSSAACPAEFTGWVLPPRRSRGLSVTPRRVDVTGDEPFVLDVGWSRLDELRRWFGAVTYEDSASLTFVTVG